MTTLIANTTSDKPADLRRIEERHPQHHGDRGQQIENVAVDEIEWVEAEPAGHRRAGGKR